MLDRVVFQCCNIKPVFLGNTDDFTIGDVFHLLIYFSLQLKFRFLLEVAQVLDFFPKLLFLSMSSLADDWTLFHVYLSICCCRLLRTSICGLYRVEYKQLDKLRGILVGVPFIGLTATATEK